MSDREDLAARLQELELRFTEQQRQIDELSDVVVAQQKDLDALLQAWRRLTEKVAATEPGLVDAESDQKPPHY